MKATTAPTTTAAADGTVPARLLGVWAHPDDEAYLTAGLMGRVADAGGHVTVATATRGEKGTDDAHYHGRPHFGHRRELELRASLAELGVYELRTLGYADGDCDRVDDREAVAAIATTITDVQPEVIVTFGPDGITGHADHRAVSTWTTRAWQETGVGRLVYAAMTTTFLADHAVVHERLGMFEDHGEPVGWPDAELALAYDLDDREIERKRRALARHASQTERLAAAMGECAYRTWWRRETFRAPTDAELGPSVPVAV